MRKDDLERIQTTMDYMEQNLKTELQLQELSELAGYSYFHYCQLFQRATGMSVMHYLTCRRLKHAIYEMSKGAKKLDVAQEYGFDTYAGFYKAFCKEYGMSPSEYLKSYQPSRPYRMNVMQEGKLMISKKIITKLLEHWGLKECAIGNVYYEGSGQTSENEFTVGEDYVLKVSGLPGGLNRHVEIAEALDKAGLQASLPIPTKDGEILLKEADVYGILCRRVKGSKMNGKEMFRTGDVEAAHRFGDVYDKLPKQLIHRNMNLSYVYLAGDEMAGVTDFELSEYCIRLFDVCYAATGILSENFIDAEDTMQTWLPLYKNIVKGYNEIVPLTEEEKQALPYVVLSIQLICVAYFADKEQFAELAKVNEQMLVRLMEHKDELAIK